MTTTIPPGVDFNRLFSPRAVAIIGASAEPSRIGGQTLRSLTEFGFVGAVYAVNPKYTEVHGRRFYPNISSVPEHCDVAIVAVPAADVPNVIDEVGAAGVSFAIVITSGFREIGDKGACIQDNLVTAARRSGVLVIGPNCQGVLSLPSRLYAGFGTTFQNPNLVSGPRALVTQSGGWGYNVVNQAQVEGIGFNYVVSTGNEAVVESLELIDYFLGQPDVDLVCCYMEGVRDGRKLHALGERALTLGKPIVVWKVGNGTAGRAAAMSHTANLTSDATLYRAVFRQGGFVEVRDVDDFVDVIRAFTPRRYPQGAKIAGLTSSGGAGVLIADACDERGLELPRWDEKFIEDLSGIVPPFGSLGNPIDVTAQLATDPERSNQVVSMLLANPMVDQVVMWKGNAMGDKGCRWAEQLVAVIKTSEKPVMLAVSPERADGALAVLDREKVPRFPTPSRAVRAAAALVQFASKRRHQSTSVSRVLSPQRVELPHGATTLGESKSKALLARYGISGTREISLSLEQIEALSFPPIPFPIAVKIDSPDVPHKTEAGAVRLNIESLPELKKAAFAVANSVKAHKPDARIEGILLQEMVSGVEMILGTINDPVFGPIAAIGMGGTYAEILCDVTHAVAPLGVPAALRMIGNLRGARMLEAFRGRPAADVQALADVLSRLSLLAVDHADRIVEIDINPLFVRPSGQGAIAADALIVTKR